MQVRISSWSAAASTVAQRLETIGRFADALIGQTV
jgi:hypothetical protein